MKSFLSKTIGIYFATAILALLFLMFFGITLTITIAYAVEPDEQPEKSRGLFIAFIVFCWLKSAIVFAHAVSPAESSDDEEKKKNRGTGLVGTVWTVLSIIVLYVIYIQPKLTTFMHLTAIYLITFYSIFALALVLVCCVGCVSVCFNASRREQFAASFGSSV